jgi:hypothetical protein
VVVAVAVDFGFGLLFRSVVTFGTVTGAGTLEGTGSEGDGAVTVTLGAASAAFAGGASVATTGAGGVTGSLRAALAEASASAAALRCLTIQAPPPATATAVTAPPMSHATAEPRDLPTPTLAAYVFAVGADPMYAVGGGSSLPARTVGGAMLTAAGTSCESRFVTPQTRRSSAASSRAL